MATRDIRRKKERSIEDKYEEAAKKKKRNPVLWSFSILILAVIIITFIGIPFTGGMASSSRLIFGYYNKQPIEYIAGNFFAQQRESLAEQMKDSITEDNFQWQMYQLWRQAFENTVVHTALLQEAKTSGVFVTDNRLDVMIAKYGPYTRNGVFDEKLYLSTSGPEKAATRNLFYGNLIQEQVVQDLIFSAKIGSKESEFIKSMASPERKFEFVAFSYDEFPQSEYVSFGEKNSDLFRRMRLSRITIRSGKKDAEAIYNQIVANPSSFEELARAHSVDGFANMGGDMGHREYYQLKGDFDNSSDLDTLFNLENGETAGPFETSFGFTIYRCDNAAIAPDFNQPEALASVKSYVQRFEKGLIEDYLISEAETFRLQARDSSLPQAAQIWRKPVYATDYFPVNFGNEFYFKSLSAPEYPGFNSAASSETALSALFSLPENIISAPIILDETIIVAKLVEERNAPEDDLTILDLYYPYIVQQFKEQHLTSGILSSDKLEDNFYPVFARLFLETQSY